MDKPCKHDWHWQPRNNHTELWNVCQLCGQEIELHVVSIEPMPKKRKRMGTSEISRRVDELFEDTD